METEVSLTASHRASLRVAAYVAGTPPRLARKSSPSSPRCGAHPGDSCQLADPSRCLAYEESVVVPW
jgi:hypothetical protein